MSEEGFSLPKPVAADMLQKKMFGEKTLKTIQSTGSVDGKSLQVLAGEAQMAFSNSITPALRRMKLDYLEQVQADCYQDKWLSDSFTNTEQIELCKDEKHEQTFGKLETMIRNHRTSDQIRLSNCRADAGEDIAMEYKCFQNYVSNIIKTNSKMKDLFTATHKSYV